MKIWSRGSSFGNIGVGKARRSEENWYLDVYLCKEIITYHETEREEVRYHCNGQVFDRLEDALDELKRMVLDIA